ncbi:hypothetical protein H4W81_008345 [Nonomuraea africana]|uniref:Uncharacterized protein n=1 Tax=Nonomuraea africana TaxID=46171 RepID=A0ABR9KU72_9ACTN|nr:hypothetical protein [Nonomuraea africana]
MAEVGSVVANTTPAAVRLHPSTIARANNTFCEKVLTFRYLSTFWLTE